MTRSNDNVLAGSCAFVWEFVVAAARRAEFEHEYGPDGRWVALFRAAPGFLGTQLLHDDGTPGRYLTVDRWRSPEDYGDFRKAFAAQYDALDHECKALTLAERSIGHFTQVGG